VNRDCELLIKLGQRFKKLQVFKRFEWFWSWANLDSMSLSQWVFKAKVAKFMNTSYFKISLDWVLLGTLPIFQICIYKKINIAFLRYRPIVPLFWDTTTKLTIFSRLFAHFIQSFDPQSLKIYQRIILVRLRPPLWAKIWIFWLFFSSKVRSMNFETFVLKNQDGSELKVEINEWSKR
jgi:hypothetical protein